jgi:hypothetical protein
MDYAPTAFLYLDPECTRFIFSRRGFLRPQMWVLHMQLWILAVMRTRIIKSVQVQDLHLHSFDSAR